MKVLLLEGDEELQQALAESLAGAGHDIVCTRTTKDARILTRESEWHALVADIVTPSRDGFEFIGEFRRIRPRATVVAIYGGGDLLEGTLFLPMAHSFGADAVLKRPFLFSDLLEAIEKGRRSAAT